VKYKEMAHKQSSQPGNISRNITVLRYVDEGTGVLTSPLLENLLNVANLLRQIVETGD